MDQTSHAKANDGGDSDTPALSSYALAAYHHQPEPLETVLPSSAGGATFFPVPPASHGGGDASLFAATIHQPPLLSPHDIAFLHLQQQQQHVPSASVPPPSAGATFVHPVQPASQQRGAAAYPPVVTAPPPSAPLSNPQEMAFHHQQQLQAFWAGQLAEAEQATELKVHSLPLARIKKIMKADQDVKMIAAEAPVVFAKACEMFILELTLRAWLHTQGTKRRTLQRSDVDAVINATEAYDFLMDDVAPEDEQKGNGGAVVPPQAPPPMMTNTAVPVPVPSSYASGPTTSARFAMYANLQPVAYMWPQQEHQHHQGSDGGGATEQG
ncbi:hypothetical protein BS78_07G081000 [Paspalum vaginatum]|nr:hypothetical protein BS78_07G081000 [Paspalum vaginatum]